MTNWGTFTPLGLEIQISSCAWWMDNQQREGEPQQVSEWQWLCRWQDSSSQSLGEQWHVFTHVSSIGVMYISAPVECPHLSTENASAKRYKNPQKKRKIRYSPSVKKRMPAGHSSNTGELWNVSASQSISEWERLRGRLLAGEVRERRNRQLVPCGLS